MRKRTKLLKRHNIYSLLRSLYWTIVLQNLSTVVFTQKDKTFHIFVKWQEFWAHPSYYIDFCPYILQIFCPYRKGISIYLHAFTLSAFECVIWHLVHKQMPFCLYICHAWKDSLKTLTQKVDWFLWDPFSTPTYKKN